MIAIPPFKLPAFVARIGGVMPQWPHSAALAAVLNVAVAKGVLDRDQLQIAAGRVVRIVVADGGATASISWRDGRFRPVAATAAADLTFRASASALLQMVLRQEDPDTLFFNRRLMIEGDTDLGLAMKNMLDAVELPKWLHWSRQ